MTKVRVLVADKNSLTCEGMCALLKAFKNVEVVGAATNNDAMIELVREKAPDLVLMDTSIPPIDIGDSIHRIRHENRATKVLLVSENENKEYILRGLKGGSNGYLPKRAEAPDLLSAITAIYRGGYFLYPSVAKVMVDAYLNLGKDKGSPYDQLSNREKEILTLIATGRKSREIAVSLEISHSTVLGHSARIMKKLGLHSRADIIKYAIREHLIELEQ